MPADCNSERLTVQIVIVYKETLKSNWSCCNIEAHIYVCKSWRTKTKFGKYYFGIYRAFTKKKTREEFVHLVVPIALIN
jgi:GTP cyclohydrolase I